MPQQRNQPSRKGRSRKPASSRTPQGAVEQEPPVEKQTSGTEEGQPSRKEQSGRRANATKPPKKSVKQERPVEKRAQRTEEGHRAGQGAVRFIFLCWFTLACAVALGLGLYLVPPAF